MKSILALRKTFVVSLSTVMTVAYWIPSQAVAAESVTPRTVTSIGCHNFNGTCYLSLDGAAFGASQGCPSGPSNDARWDNASETDSTGRRTFAALYGAFLSGKKVSVAVEGCSFQGYAKLVWYTVSN